MHNSIVYLTNYFLAKQSSLSFFSDSLNLSASFYDQWQMHCQRNATSHREPTPLGLSLLYQPGPSGHGGGQTVM